MTESEHQAEIPEIRIDGNVFDTKTLSAEEQGALSRIFNRARKLKNEPVVRTEQQQSASTPPKVERRGYTNDRYEDEDGVWRDDEGYEYLGPYGEEKN